MTVPASDAARFCFTVGGIEFLVVDFTATEKISEPFEVRLNLASEDRVPCEAALGHSGCLTVQGRDHERCFHGLVTEFFYREASGRLERYEARLAPQAALLNLRSDCRIFAGLTVPQIVAQVFKAAGLDPDGWAFRLQGKYPPREHCVQYRESDLAFVRRLLAQEGIYFFFEHDRQRHRMVFGDSPAAYGRIAGERTLDYHPGAGLVPEHEAIIDWARTFTLTSDRVELGDYNFERPALNLTTASSGQDKGRTHYDYPGGHRLPDQGRRLARVREEQQRMYRDLAEGRSTKPGLAPGLIFKTDGHLCAADDGAYLAVQVRHRGDQPQSIEEVNTARGTIYVNTFTAVPAEAIIRPEPLPKPVIRGVQTAIVTGAADGQIHTDRHGRVQVRFHWERGTPAGTWVRVTQSWAGTAWGAVHLPRAGQEVIVGFEEGDPDRPMITGRLYHGQNLPPYPLPAQKSVSTIKSRSTSGEGFNEIRFEDRKEGEQLFVHAQRQMDLVVENDRRTFVGRSAHTHIQGSRLTHIGGSRHFRVGADAVETIDGVACLTVGKDLERKSGGDHVLQTGGSMDIAALADAVLEAGARLTLKVGPSFVTIGSSGIAIGAPRINFNSGGSALTGRGTFTQSPLAPQSADGALAGETSESHPVPSATIRPDAAIAPGPASAAAPVSNAIPISSAAPGADARAGTPVQPLRLKQQLVDIVHITGEAHFYVLDQDESEALKQEIDEVQRLIDEFHHILQNADDCMACLNVSDPEAECGCIRCQKQRWALKARDAGLLTLTPTEDIAPDTHLTTAEDLQGRLYTLRQARDFYQAYHPRLLRDGLKGSYVESNWQALRQVKLNELHGQIAAVQRQLDERPAPEPDARRPASVAGAPSDGAKSKRAVAYERGRQSSTGTQVIEVVVFSRPDRRYYIRARYREQVSWRRTVHTDVLRTHPFNRQLATRLIADIKQGIKDDADTSTFGTLEARLKTWSSRDDNLLNALHREFAWTSDHADAARYAVSAEAHLLRFAASASAGINSWQIDKGQVEIGVKAGAAISLAEGKVALNTFYPSQGGYPLHLSYRNGLGQTIHHPFGALRLHGSVVLSCFTGAQAFADAGIKATYKAQEVASGATALLGTPSVSVGLGGRLGLKAEAFAGARAGGSLSGDLQWLAPAHQGRGARLYGRQMSGAGNWRELATVKTEGNVAAGLGAGANFGLSISKDQLTFNCNASLVFGPGAAGGFGTIVDFEKIYDVIKLVCEALADIDYRYLYSVTEEAFKFISFGIYQAISSPGRTAAEIFQNGFREVMRWWQFRTFLKAEAERIATNLLQDRTVLLDGKSLSIGKLPPETVGPMIYVLSESFIGSWESGQEEAIVLLLSSIGSWHQFVKVLEHMSPKAEKVNAAGSLNRLNSILDGRQQDQFNQFIHNLPESSLKAENKKTIAWATRNPNLKREILIAAKTSGLFDGVA
ncbi:type VI secretion system Vgr family protein [Desulfatitalea tepidiphila]|uniref:type VI secretion system Vgr family protein n=1 Tax=Desulfatitalea tepidiphila TaxID=1185843 RepID=UPI0009F9D285|nr:type VI secretion system tip protein TssI/VgrG [Desulfatitalea tepidiphila]